MPKETFYPHTATQDDGSQPTLTVTWGNEQPGVEINGAAFDRSAVNRLINVLRKARDQSHGTDE